jgi:Tol biopolymer transport system component
MKRIPRFLYFCAVLVTLLLTSGKPAQAQFTRGTQMMFGKNRVQYNDFLWSFYRFKDYDTYFYLGGQELAIFTGRTAEEEIHDLEKIFDYRISGRFQFMVYNKLSDLRQSNIGLEGSEQAYNTGGLTKIIGTKVLIYFDGDYRHFREQIRAGIAQVMINQLMYGGSVKDRLQSAVLLTLPEWYTQGLVSYVARGWNIDDDNRMRDGINTGKYRKLNALAGADATFAGHSMWNYIVTTYGSSSISNLLYMTRINRNIESGFTYVLGSNLKELSTNWRSYYQRIYLDEDKLRPLPTAKPSFTMKKPARIIQQMKVSPDGNRVAYITNELGKFRVWLYDNRTHKKKRIARGGYKTNTQATDYTTPVLAWQPNGRTLTAIKEKKGKLWMDYYTIGKRKVKRETNKFFYFEKVLDFSYNASGSEIVISGIQKGQSDLFVFSPRTKTTVQLTKDRWEDFSPRFVLDDRYIVFSSTRTEDSIKPTNFRQADNLETPSSTDIYLYDYINRSEKLIPVTSTPGINETNPMMIDSSHFTFLSDENGIVNRFVSTIDSTIAYVDTIVHYRYISNVLPQSNYSRNVQLHDVNSRGSHYAQVIRNKGKYSLYLSAIPDIDSTYIDGLPPTAFRKKGGFNTSSSPKEKTSTIESVAAKMFENAPKKDSALIDITNFEFQSEFPSRKKKPELPSVIKDSVRIATPSAKELMEEVATKTASKDTSYQVPKQRNYELAFATTYLLTQLDNNLLNETYQAYTGGAVYFDPGLNALIRIGVNDLMDDYRLTGGFRLSGNLNSNEYYVAFEDLKRRMDKQMSFYRQAREEISAFSYYKVHTHEAKYQLRWPLNDLTSIRGTVAYRNDRIVNLSTDLVNLRAKNRYENWGSTRLEFVFDNTISTGLNLYNGLRYKVFAEYFREVDERNSSLGVLGADVRHYLKIHRQIIWANRFAASTTFGERKLVYYLGSTDNTFAPSDNFYYNIQVDQSQNYAFQALATNLRGFKQNIRNGNNFALINSELRIPIFQYLINRPIRSDFVRNFQIVGFGDIGTAWTGTSPYSKNNSLFTVNYPGQPISIIVTKDVEPLVAGYGFGLRSRILGYFLRADWAWGVDDSVVQPRIFYFSLGLDF